MSLASRYEKAAQVDAAEWASSPRNEIQQEAVIQRIGEDVDRPAAPGGGTPGPVTTS